MSAHPSLPWRRSGRFLAATVFASFVSNEIWEMAQMSAYVQTAGHSWASTLGLCTRAAVGDVGIILGIYAACALVAGDLGWGSRGRWSSYATAAVLGLAYAGLVEHAALASGRWAYTERMPVLSVLNAGEWPLLQMTLLPPLAFLFARWWTGRSIAKSAGECSRRAFFVSIADGVEETVHVEPKAEAGVEERWHQHGDPRD